MAFTVLPGTRYHAEIRLTGLEKLASAAQVKGKLEELGFSDVVVAGSGGSFSAEGLWTRAARSEDLPASIVSIAAVVSSTPQTAPSTPPEPESASTPDPVSSIPEVEPASTLEPEPEPEPEPEAKPSSSSPRLLLGITAAALALLGALWAWRRFS